MSSYRYVHTDPHLAGIEKCAEPPLNFRDTCIQRTYLRGLTRTLDTATALLFGAKDNTILVTSAFPWRNIKPEYLGDSKLGKRSIIEIIPSELGGIQGARFRLVRASDFPWDFYATPINAISGEGPYTKEELQRMGSGLIGKEQTRDQAWEHPLLYALFEDDESLLHNYIDGVYTFPKIAKQNLALKITVPIPGRAGALLWAMYGLNGLFHIEAKDFTKDKTFTVRTN